MKKKLIAGLLLAALCLLAAFPAGMAETRQGVIALEGMEEPIEETLFDNHLDFSFWYASEWLDAYRGEKDGMDGAIVTNPDSEDFMVLSMITEEEAAEYTEDFDESIVDQSAQARVQTDVYRDLEDGRYYFLTLIGEKGRYLRAVGEYAQEAAEGNAKFFQRVLDSIEFTPGCLLRADWGEPLPDEEEEGRAQVILTALAPLKEISLLRLDWSEVNVTWESTVPLADLDTRQSVAVTLEFIGDMPGNGVRYTDEGGIVHAYALDISGEDGSLIFWDLEE